MEIDRVERCMEDYYEACDQTDREAEAAEMDEFSNTITSLVDGLGTADGCDATEADRDAIQVELDDSNALYATCQAD